MNARRVAEILLALVKRSEYRKVHKAADKHYKPLKKLMSEAFEKGHDALHQRRLERALELQDELAVLGQASDAILAVQNALRFELPALLLDAFEDGGRAAAGSIRRLRASKMRSAVDVEFEFDRTNPRATEWAREHAGELIMNITETTRDQIRDLVEDAFEEQFTVEELADEIASIIGDEDRADKIAHTETMRAANEGVLEAWQQATESGLLEGTEKKEWITTPDDRLCPICEPLDGQTVGLNEQFDVEGGDLDGPPAHPNCRCTLGLSL